MIAEQVSDHLLTKLLPQPRPLRYIVKADPDDQPTIVHQMHVPHPLVGILPAVELGVMSTVRIDFNRDMNARANIGEIEKPAAIEKIMHLIFGVKMLEMAECRPPDMPKKLFLCVGMTGNEFSFGLTLPIA